MGFNPSVASLADTPVGPVSVTLVDGAITKLDWAVDPDHHPVSPRLRGQWLRRIFRRWRGRGKSAIVAPRGGSVPFDL